jgi:multidrug resistance efflux pump
MDSLPPIPTPAGQRWREFRIQALPLLVFSCIVIAAAFLWRSLIIPMNLVGQAEAVTASVTVTVPGLIESLSADRFAEVTNGQEIATLIPFDPDFTSASLSTIESDLNVTKARMDLNELARLDTAVRLRLDLETQRTLLSVAQVQYTEAESILERNKKLLQDNIISQAAFDLLRLNRDRWKTEVEERTKVIAEWRREVENFGPRLTNSFAGMDLIIQKDVEAQQEQLRQQQKRIILRAPISGKVSAVLHRANERVPAGTAILTITPLHPELSLLPNCPFGKMTRGRTRHRCCHPRSWAQSRG